MSTQIATEAEVHAGNLGRARKVAEHGAPSNPGPGTMGILILMAHKKWLIAKTVAIATLIGVVTSFLWPVRYTATTQIMTPQQSEPAALMMSQFVNSATGSMAALASGGLSLRSPNDLYVGMLGSRPIADAVIRQFDLMKEYHAKDMTAARKKLSNRTGIVSEKSSLISVSVTDSDKVKASAMANAFVEQLRDLTQTMAATEASQRREFFEGQVKDAKEQLIAAEAEFQRVQQSKGVIQPEDQAKVIIESLAALRAEITAKNVELQTLLSYSTDRNPQVLLAEKELASMQAAEARMEQKQHSGGFTNLGLGDVPGAGLDYLNAQHELVYRQTLFDLLIKQFEAAKLDEAKEATIVHVVTPAIPPDRKSSPRRVLIVLLFMLVGVILACLRIYIAELMRKDPSISKNLTDIKLALFNK